MRLDNPSPASPTVPEKQEPKPDIEYVTSNTKKMYLKLHVKIIKDYISFKCAYLHVTTIMEQFKTTCLKYLNINLQSYICRWIKNFKQEYKYTTTCTSSLLKGLASNMD